MSRRLLVPLALLAVLLAACGREPQRDTSGDEPVIGVRGSEEAAAATDLGFPAFATKNTTRVGGGDPVANAAAVARAVFPGFSPGTRPRAVTLVDGRDWRLALAAASLMGRPIRAPLLLSDGTTMPPATAAGVPQPEGLRATDVRGRDPFAVARAIDAFQSAARGATSDRVLIVNAERPEFAMPAAAWAAKSGDPILFVGEDEVPLDTRAALAAHQQPRIYVLGPSEVISPKVTRILRRLGTVTRLGGENPVANAIAFARFADGPFGWGVVDPGHGLVFASTERPLDAAAAAPLSASGKYGPLLLLDDAGKVPGALRDYLLDIQPGYTDDPVRGVYNHGWVVGDDDAISVPVQSRLDSLLEIRAVTQRRP